VSSLRHLKLTQKSLKINHQHKKVTKITQNQQNRKTGKSEKSEKVKK